MKAGDKVKVITNGKIGTVETVGEDQAMVRFPAKRQGWTTIMPYTIRSLEVLEEKKDDAQMEM